MNTEINFLEKQPNKYIAPLLFGIVFALLLASAVGVLMVQKNNAIKSIAMEQETIAEMESLLLDYQSKNAEEQHLKEVQAAMTIIEESSFPTVALYSEVIGLLPTPGQMIDYDLTTTDQFVIEAEFEAIEKVAEYVAALLELGYVSDALLNSVVNMESAYQATLTIYIESEDVVEELGIND
ncbi:hypothetical protein QGM71_00340 [Virgibacillus sp. C22-A2]|uniref:Uncharacterized protein n=1 Tax=Virgibacillus tibetensis TaxID=3042313 RepID=A0ABU6K9R8_9BACI|nr:hypothetical protein [Virgibacillus sp. C22-A2]